jgi:pyridoxal phosphate enzyme (YggS family)
MSIAKNLSEIRQRIDAITPHPVKIVAVTKYAPVDGTIHTALLEAGCNDFGESRPQLLEEKAAFYAGQNIRWHQIGTLQRNKIRKIVPLTALIHSIDSVKLAEAIERVAEEEHIETVHCLLEVFVSGEASKHGFDPSELPAALQELGGLRHLAVDGLMAMAGLDANETETRRQFAAVRELRDSLNKTGTPDNVHLTELSMGMSSDFEIAVAEGATIVRIGTMLYD